MPKTISQLPVCKKQCKAATVVQFPLLSSSATTSLTRMPKEPRKYTGQFFQKHSFHFSLFKNDYKKKKRKNNNKNRRYKLMSELTSLLFSLHWRLTNLQKILPCSRTTPPELTRKGVNLAFEKQNLVKKRNRRAIVFQVTIYFPSTGEQKEFKRRAQPPPRPKLLFFHPKKFGKPCTFQNMWEFISCLKSVLYNNEWQ